MKERDEIAEASAAHWERMAREGCGFTRPWLGLDRDTIERYVRGELTTVPESLSEMYPAALLAGV